MLNKLDNKLILDRQFAVELLDCLDVNDPDHGQVAQKLREIMSAQDNTGWAAGPVLSTIQMDVDGSSEMLGDEFAGLDSDVAAKVWNAMLEASPPLLETKRETK